MGKGREKSGGRGEQKRKMSEKETGEMGEKRGQDILYCTVSRCKQSCRDRAFAAKDTSDHQPYMGGEYKVQCNRGGPVIVLVGKFMVG